MEDRKLEKNGGKVQNISYLDSSRIDYCTYKEEKQDLIAEFILSHKTDFSTKLLSI